MSFLKSPIGLPKTLPPDSKITGTDYTQSNRKNRTLGAVIAVTANNWTWTSGAIHTWSDGTDATFTE